MYFGVLTSDKASMWSLFKERIYLLSQVQVLESYLFPLRPWSYKKRDLLVLCSISLQFNYYYSQTKGPFFSPISSLTLKEEGVFKYCHGELII